MNNVSPLWVLLDIHLRWRGCGYSLAIPACFFGVQGCLDDVDSEMSNKLGSDGNARCRCNLYCIVTVVEASGDSWHISYHSVCFVVSEPTVEKIVAMTCCPLLIYYNFSDQWCPKRLKASYECTVYVYA